MSESSATQERKRNQQLVTDVIAAVNRGGEVERNVRHLISVAWCRGSDHGYNRRRGEERAGAELVDYATFRSLLAEGFHTAFRKAVDHPYAVVIHLLIRELRGQEWGAVLDFTADPLWGVLRDGGIDHVPVPAADRLKLDDLASQVLAHLRVPEHDPASRAELAVKSLLAQVFNLGRSIGYDERVEDEEDARKKQNR